MGIGPYTDAYEAEKARRAAQTTPTYDSTYQTPAPNPVGQAAKLAATLSAGGAGGAAATSGAGSAGLAAESAANAANAWGAGSGGSATLLGSETLGAVAGPAAIAAGLYGLGSNWGKGNVGASALSGASTGAGAGFMLGGPVGGAIGAGVGGLAGAGLGLIHTGRTNQDHIQRSAYRDNLAKAGFALRTPKLGGNLNAAVDNPSGTYVPLADGSYYDISREDNGQAHTLLNENNEWSQQARGWAMSIAAILQPGNRKLFDDTVAQLANGMRSNTNDIEGIRANALAIFERLGMNRNQAIAGINQLASSGKISASEAAAYVNGINTMFDGKGYVSNADLAAHVAKSQAPTATPVATPQVTQSAQSTADKIQNMGKPGVNLK